MWIVRRVLTRWWRKKNKTKHISGELLNSWWMDVWREKVEVVHRLRWCDPGYLDQLLLRLLHSSDFIFICACIWAIISCMRLSCRDKNNQVTMKDLLKAVHMDIYYHFAPHLIDWRVSKQSVDNYGLKCFPFRCSTQCLLNLDQLQATQLRHSSANVNISRAFSSGSIFPCVKCEVFDASGSRESIILRERKTEGDLSKQEIYWCSEFLREESL